MSFFLLISRIFVKCNFERFQLFISTVIFYEENDVWKFFQISKIEGFENSKTERLERLERFLFLSLISKIFVKYNFERFHLFTGTLIFYEESDGRNLF